MGIGEVIKSRAVFLDRDGVINKAIIRNGKPYPPGCLSELALEPGVKEGLEKLRHLGYLLICITNQPDVARGKTERKWVEKINEQLLSELPLKEILVCYHDDANECHCRKPKPGLLYAAAEKYAIELEESFMIGDRWKDIDAGNAAMCQTIWLNRGYDEMHPKNPHFVTTTFMDAVNWIVGSTTGNITKKEQL